MPASRSLIVTLSLAGLAALGGYAYVVNRAPAPAQAASAPAAPPAIGVEVVTVASESIPDDVMAVGTLRSSESVILRPEVAGRISAIRFVEGREIARGTVMVELDAAVQRAELQQARANLALAESNYRRTEDLFNRNFVSQSARDEAASRLEVARASEALSLARLEQTRVRAPFTGIVGIRNVSVGDYVKEGEDLVHIEAIATLKVDFRLPESYVDRIRRGQMLDVVSDALPDRRFAATVDAIDPLVDAEGRAVLLRARLDNAGNSLRPGMFARVRVILSEPAEVAVVPEEALVPTGGGQFVFVVEDGKARRVPVKIGARRDTRVEVTDGLQPGQQVVTAGQIKLRDGATVRVATLPAPARAAAPVSSN